MSDKEFEYFQKNYPNLFKEYPSAGFYLCPGWTSLVNTLSKVLEFHIENLPHEIREGIYCDQLKEKFGTMRFYMSNSTPFIDGAIALAESMSGSICDTCGMPGIRRKGGWIRTQCDSCFGKKL